MTDLQRFPPLCLLVFGQRWWSKTRLSSNALLLGACLLGCGRPATEQDCERIVARVAELELQKAEVSDPAAVESQVQSAQSAFRQRMQMDCVGRRLRASSLECVEKATSASQIVSECF